MHFAGIFYIFAPLKIFPISPSPPKEIDAGAITTPWDKYWSIPKTLRITRWEHIIVLAEQQLLKVKIFMM